MKLTRKAYREHLNRVVRDECRCDRKYGNYLQRKDPIQFDVGYQEWKRQKEALCQNQKTRSWPTKNMSETKANDAQSAGATKSKDKKSMLPKGSVLRKCIAWYAPAEWKDVYELKFFDPI